MPRIPPSLGRRSGYELRVIASLDDKWPFVAEDRLAAAAHGLDVFKKKHPDDWQWLLEANAHPDAASETIVRTILNDYDRSAARKAPLSQRSPLEQAIHWAQMAYSALRAGMPEGARESLGKAEAVIERDPELKRIPGLQGKLRGCFQALGSYDPRSADRLVEAVVSLLRRSAPSHDRTASADRYVVKFQERGRPPGDMSYPTEAAAHEYAQRILKAWPRLTYLAIEHHQDDAIVDKTILKGTATSTDKKLTKLRADLAKLKKYQAQAVGPLNKAEFDADIEWTEREIARLSR